MTQAIEQALREHAYSGDETTLEWTIHVHPGFARVEAATRATYDTAQEAFSAAVDLRAQLLGVGAEPIYQCRLSAESDDDGTSGWRGHVALGLSTHDPMAHAIEQAFRD